MLLHMDLGIIGFALAHAFGVLLFVSVWALLLGRRTDDTSIWACLLLGVFPGAIYFDAVFPMSLAALLTVFLIYSAANTRKPAAAVCAFLLPMAYSTGWLVVAGVWAGLLIAQWRFEKGRRQLGKSWIHILPVLGVAGIVCTFFMMWKDTGLWNLFFRTQASFQRNAPPPFSGILYTWWRGLQVWEWDLHRADEILVLLTCLMMFLILRDCWQRRTVLRTIDIVVLAVTFGIWILPMTMGNYPSYYRAYTLLLPIALLFPNLHTIWRKFFVCTFTVLSVLVGRLFFRGTIM